MSRSTTTGQSASNRRKFVEVEFFEDGRIVVFDYTHDEEILSEIREVMEEYGIRVDKIDFESPCG